MGKFILFYFFRIKIGKGKKSFFPRRVYNFFSVELFFNKKERTGVGGEGVGELNVNQRNFKSIQHLNNVKRALK